MGRPRTGDVRIVMINCNHYETGKMW